MRFVGRGSGRKHSARIHEIWERRPPARIGAFCLMYLERCGPEARAPTYKQREWSGHFAIDQHGQKKRRAVVGGPAVAGSALDDDLAWFDAGFGVVEHE